MGLKNYTCLYNKANKYKLDITMAQKILKMQNVPLKDKHD